MVRSNGQVAVRPTLQLTSHPNVFVIGDAADAFGAINAGHTAWDQATVAGQNILALIKNSYDDASTGGGSADSLSTPTVQSDTKPNQNVSLNIESLKLSDGLTGSISAASPREEETIRLERRTGKSKLWSAAPEPTPPTTGAAGTSSTIPTEKDACTCSGCDCALAPEPAATPSGAASLDQRSADTDKAKTLANDNTLSGGPRRESAVELTTYKATPPAIKVSLGLSRSIRQTQSGQLLQAEGGAEDLNSINMWTRRGLPTDNLYL